MAGSMEGKAGLVTGAASGIGRACAIRFGQEGAAVVVADLERSREGGEETVRAIEDAGGRAEFFACDVAEAADNDALVARVVESYGNLDFAHNNAGIGVHTPLHERVVVGGLGHVAGEELGPPARLLDRAHGLLAAIA